MGAQRKDRDADPISFLVDDHERLQKLFRSVEAAKGNAVRRALAERACAELKIHTALEAEIFYPAARAALGRAGGSIVNRAEADHTAAARLIGELEDPASDDTSYAANFAQLAARIRSHFDREEREIFARLRQCSMDLAIAARLRRRKDALLRAEDVPGQIEPSAEAEGEYEPELGDALTRRLVR